MCSFKLVPKEVFIYLLTSFVIVFSDNLVAASSIVCHESPSAEMSFSPHSVFFSRRRRRSGNRPHNWKGERNIIFTENSNERDDEMSRGRNFLLSASENSVHQVKKRSEERRKKADFDLFLKKEDGFKSSTKFHPVILSSFSTSSLPSPSSSLFPGPIPLFSSPLQQSKSFQTFASSAKTYLSSSPSLPLPSSFSQPSSTESLASPEFHGLQNLLKKKKWIQKPISCLDFFDDERGKEKKHGQRSLKMKLGPKIPFRQELLRFKQGDRTTRYDDDGDEDQDSIPLLAESGNEGDTEEDILARLKSFEGKVESGRRNVEKSFFKLSENGEMRKEKGKKNKSITVSSSLRGNNPRLLSRKKRFFLTGTFQLPSLFLEVLSMMRKSRA